MRIFQQLPRDALPKAQGLFKRSSRKSRHVKNEMVLAKFRQKVSAEKRKCRRRAEAEEEARIMTVFGRRLKPSSQCRCRALSPAM